MTANRDFKVREAQRMTWEQLEWALRVNKVFATKGAEDCRENVEIYEAEIARRLDTPFR